jgi:beta-N-acetylhexosaminidase
MFSKTKAIISIQGPTLLEEERHLLKIYQPLGLIIMGRNIESKKQLSLLCQEIKKYVPYILVDQEGGAVRRLKGSEFYDAKDMQYFGALHDNDPDQAIQELRYQTQKVAQDLNDCHINVNCAPCLDLHYDHPDAEKHVISFYKRAFHKDPTIVGKLGEIVCRTFLQAGITPVIKHLPGHGRSTGADPHLGICHVDGDLLEDVIPFRHIVKKNLSVWGMTNHVIYDGLDPTNPVALSAPVIDHIRNHIGFHNLLMTDAIDMKALDKILLQEKVRLALQVGHDTVLYCAGDLAENHIILQAAKVAPI